MADDQNKFDDALDEIKGESQEESPPDPTEPEGEESDVSDEEEEDPQSLDPTEAESEPPPEEDGTTYAVLVPGGEGEEDKKFEVPRPVYDYVKHLKEELSNAREVISAKDNTITKLSNEKRELEKNAQVGNR